jgi:hypothetical protein
LISIAFQILIVMPDVLLYRLDKIEAATKKLADQAMAHKQKMIKGKKGVLLGTGKRAGKFTTLEVIYVVVQSD